jgi:RHS repeat-associated protein
MRIAACRLVVCLLFCVGVGCWSAGASEAVFATETASPSSSLSGGLVVAGVQSLDEGQQLRAQREARRMNPAAVVEREASGTMFSGLTAAKAIALAREVFPKALDAPAGGLPKLGGVRKIVGFPSDHAASLVLNDGKHALVESLSPIAVKSSSGGRVPIDLNLTATNGGFEPMRAMIGVHIPRRLAEGVQLGGSGVSLTPMGGSGTPVAGAEGRVAGASVVYASTLADADTLIKPAALGFEADTLLRSVRSPERIAYRVGMPSSARLVQDATTRVVRVVDRGETVATVLPPSATDAAGTPVPVSMSASGDVLTLHVKHSDGKYRYPILVDPYIGVHGIGLNGESTNWVFLTNNKNRWSATWEPSYIALNGPAEFNNAEYGIISNTTQGDSAIGGFQIESWGILPKGSEADLFVIAPPSTLEDLLNPSAALTGTPELSDQFALCHNSNGCPEGEIERGAPENTAQYGLWTYGSGAGGPYTAITYALIAIWQPEGPHISVNEAWELPNGEHNALFGVGGWIGPHSNSAFEVKASDPGIGVSHYNVETTAHNWVETHNYLGTSECGGVECPRNRDPIYGYSSSWPDGEDAITGGVEDAMGAKAELGTRVLKVDSEPPKLTVSGLKNGSEIGEGQYGFTVEATDGTGAVKTSGLQPLTLMVDGREIRKTPFGYPGGSTKSRLTAEWELNGGEFGAGEHRVTVTATDGAGNVTTESFTIKVRHATPVALGPGSVNPQSGEFSMLAGDVSIAAPGGGLTVGRSYGSRHLTAGSEGPLGPQWRLDVGGQEGITRSLLNQNQVSATLTAATGGQVTFVGKGKSFASPAGDANLALTEEVNGSGEPTEFVLKNAADGTTARFTSTTGPTATLWKATKQEGPVASETVRYTYQTVEGVTEPVEALAPEPANVTCGKEIKELKAGCRALGFEYASETTAKGEKPSEWGAYKGRLKAILYYAYNPATKEIKPIRVAEYSYNAKGWLRAEWNPQITPTLKTTYGYDGEGHVTSVSPAGQEPWLLHYGTDALDTNAGRVISVIRPAASSPTELASAAESPPPSNTTAPTLSSSEPKVGVKISVASNGTWSNSPLAYSYQWERCISGKECSPIAGAVNQSYYPNEADHNQTIRAVVTAVNANGAVTALTALVGQVQSGTPNSPAPEPPNVGTSSVWTVEYQVPLSGSELQTMTKAEVAKWGQTDVPAEATAIFPPDKPMGWPANAYKRATIEYLDGQGRTVNAASPTGGVSTSEYNKYNDIIRSLSADNRAAALKEGCISESSCKSAEVSKLLDTQSTYEEGGSEPGSELLSTLGPQHTIGLPSGTQVEARAHTVDSYNEGAPAEGGPYHLVTKTTQGAIVAGKEEPETVRTTVMSYTGTGSQEGLGWKLRKPISVTTDPSGLDLVHTTEYDPNTGEVIQTKTPAATGKDTKVPPTYTAQFGAKGAGAGQLEKPTYDAVDAHGNVWVVEYADNRISEFSASGAFIETVGWGVSNGEAKLEVCTTGCKAGIAGAGKGQLAEPDGIAIAGGDIYVVDSGNDRVEVLNEKGEWVTQWGSLGTGAGQFKIPLAIAVSSTNKVWVGDSINRRVQEFSSTGTFIEAIGWGVSNGKAEYQVCTSSCQAGLKGSGNGQLSAIWGMAFAGSNLYVADTSNNRIEEFNEKSEYVAQFGASGKGNGQLEFPTGVAVSPTTGLLYVTDTNNNRMQVFTQSGAYLTQFARAGAGNGQLQFPEGNAVNSTGEVFVVDDLNHRVEKWVPTITGNEGAHATKTVYYSAKEEAEVPACRNHPEWAALPCQTGPAAQPGGGLPELPVTTVSAYNVWDEPETIVEAVGASTRTKTEIYDPAGRLKTASTTSTVGTALPTVTDSYTAETGAETGALTTQSTTVEGKTQKLTSVFNTLGQLTSYTDADGATATYEYDVDGRVHKTNDGKGTQTETYNETTGLPSELVDSSHEGMKFTATYDAEGNMLTEGYPNGMTAFYSRNSIGTTTGLEYKKLTNCTEEAGKCKWFTDSVVPSIQGQWLSQTSTFSKQAYKYDAAGRLTEAQNTPTGKVCTSRIYAQDEDTNRTSLTTRESATEKCATEGGTIESHTFSSADQLTDPGTVYNPFGDITTLPARDAGGKEPSEALTNAYYVNNQVASQTQTGQTVGYNLDPAGRTRETVATGKKVSDITSHYAGPSNSPAWTMNTSGETSRNILGIDGQLAAIQNNSETPVIQLANLHGDIIATAYLSETATEPASKSDTSEYGVPTTTLPAKYSWLGAIELPTELASGVTTMGARSYVPQIGRFLQPDPISGGSANAYSYTFGDPVNSSDPSGEYTYVGSYVNAADEQLANSSTERHAIRVAAEEAEQRASEEAAAREAAEYAAYNAAWAAGAAAGPQYTEEWEEWWEEEGSYEYISQHHGEGGKEGREEPHLEQAVLYQPLGEVTQGLDGDGEGTVSLGVVPSCKAGAVGPCAHEVRAVCRGGKCHGGNAARPVPPPACARQHDCPFPEPSNWAPVKYVTKKVLQAGKIVIEIAITE